jgi:hypothetical protein
MSPEVVCSIVFGIFMAIVGICALWQGHKVKQVQKGMYLCLLLSKGELRADLYCLSGLIDIEMQRLTANAATLPRMQVNLLLLKTSNYSWTSKEPVGLSECLPGSRLGVHYRGWDGDRAMLTRFGWVDKIERE